MIRRGTRFQLLWIALLLIFGLAAPLPYVLVEPGTPNDTLGKVKGKPLLEIVGSETFPTKGKLNLTSIWVTSPNSHLQTFELLRAWIDGERSVQPREVFYPQGTDPAKVTKESVAEMKSSQLSAQLATLRYLEIPYTERLIIRGFTELSPNKKILRKGDQLISFEGAKLTSSAKLKSLLAKTRTKRVELGVIRDGKAIVIPITIGRAPANRDGENSGNPSSNGKTVNFIGLYISEKYDLPFTVKINLKKIGGPSAGLIFSLAMIEKLGAEDLVRGRNIAGTGTIEPNGEVGPIGGIEEKLIGAAREGATLFIAPSLNCPDIRHIPRGLQVVPVDTLTEAISVLREKDPERLPMCG